MGTRSSIRKLPEQLRAEVDRLLADGRYTLTDVVEHLRTLGVHVSRSAVGRYAQDFEQIASDIRYTREMAIAIAGELEATPDRDSARLVIESLQALLLRARMQLARKEELDIGTLEKLARATKDLQSAWKSNVDTELKIRDRVLKEATAAVETVATEQGLSADMTANFRTALLGLQRPSGG